MTTKIIVIISIITFTFSVGFSLYYSNTIANYNYRFNQKTDFYHQQLLINDDLIDKFNTIINMDNLITPKPDLEPITKTFP